MRKIKKLLVANRGEIACKIIKSAKKLNIPTLAIYSDEDINSIHVSLADEAINIPGSNVSDTYMNSMAIINICKKYKANAIHPGYGLLSENAAFVELVEKNNLIFVGPNSEIIRNMGQKDKAKSLMENAGLPVVPGYHGAKQDKDFLKQTASNIGYPVLIKAVAGGGGRGMRIAEDNKTFLSALTEASNEAKTNFQDKNCLIEKYIPLARHIEIQIFADKHGNVIHLFDRDCSLQRRQQKIIEEAPAPKIDDEIRSFLGDISVKAAKAIQYEGAGTIEFIADIKNGLDKNKIYFMEMNTRIQVEHPVTEAVTSTDLITWQLQIANGKKLPKLQNEIIIDGWAIEARLYAEDAKKNFMPQIGLINHFTLPNQLKHPNCFMETGTKLGDFISPYYDPMIGKIISHGRNRNEAIKNLTSYLSEFEIAGITTNLDLLKKLLKDNDFKKGNINTKFVENNIIKFVENNIPNADIALTGLIVFKNLIKNQDNYWSMWRPSHYPIKLLINNTIYSFNFIYSKLDEIEVHFDELRYKLSSIKIFNSSLFARLNKKDLSIRYNVFKEKNLGKKMFTIFTENNTYQAQIFNPLIITENQKRFSPDKIISPMHGIIKFKSIKKNLHVKKGEVLMLLEAMKMQYSLTSPRDGIIEKIYIKDGEQAIEGMELLSLKEKIMIDNFINIFEMSPRDGLQNEKNFISTNDKIKFIDNLSSCGFKKIETSSFVSPKWVPQLSDAGDVFRRIKRNKGVKYTALTPNEKGFDDAMIAEVDEVAIFTAASETFCKKNTNCDIETSLIRFKPIMNKAVSNKLPVRGYISCVSHCPYEDYVDPQKVAEIANELINMGCYEVSLGDTTGKGNAEQTLKVIKECLKFISPKFLAGHFHDTYQNALDNIMVCIENGIRTFDSSVGGLGGCPYSPGAKGNVATEKVNELVLSMGYNTNLDSSKINECSHIAKQLKKTGSYS